MGFVLALEVYENSKSIALSEKAFIDSVKIFRSVKMAGN